MNIAHSLYITNRQTHTHTPEDVCKLCLLHNAHHQHIDGPDDLWSILQLGEPVVQDDVDKYMHHVPQHIPCCLGAQLLVVEHLGMHSEEGFEVTLTSKEEAL